VSAVTLFSADEGGNPHYWRASDHSTQRASNGNREESAKMTFGQAAEIHLRNLDDNLRIKPRTRHYWRQRFAAFIKSWPGLDEMEIRRITPAECKKWASIYPKIASPTNYNTPLRFFATF
jgi:hypothetical protein